MAKIKVAHPFTLQRDNGRLERFEIGHYDDVDDEVANHWYTKAHLEDAETPPPVVGTPEYAQRMREQQLAREAALDEKRKAEGDDRVGPPRATLRSDLVQPEQKPFELNPEQLSDEAKNTE
jgi:hypothetical protein